LIRPQATYVGPPLMPWVPIENRGRSTFTGTPASVVAGNGNGKAKAETAL
jgi:hypothetical protein